MGKKGKKYPAHQIARKKNSWWAEINHPPPPPPQELNGRSLSEERKIAQKVKFARIAHDWQLNIKVSGSWKWQGVLEK